MNINEKENEAVEKAKQLIEQVKSGLNEKELEAVGEAKQLVDQVKERIKKELK